MKIPENVSIKEFANQIKKINATQGDYYDILKALLSLISQLFGLAIFRLPEEDCDEENLSIPVLKFLFLNLNIALDSENSREKIERYCEDIKKGKISNVLFFNNPSPNENSKTLITFKENFEKLLELYAEKYEIEIILVGISKSHENNMHYVWFKQINPKN